LAAKKMTIPVFGDGEREMMGFPCGKVLMEFDDANSPLHPTLVDAFWKIGIPTAIDTTPLARIRKVGQRRFSLSMDFNAFNYSCRRGKKAVFVNSSGQCPFAVTPCF